LRIIMIIPSLVPFRRVDLLLGGCPTESFEGANAGTIRFEDQNLVPLTMSADYLPHAIVIYISRGNLYLTIGITSRQSIIINDNFFNMLWTHT